MFSKNHHNLNLHLKLEFLKTKQSQKYLNFNLFLQFSQNVLTMIFWLQCNHYMQIWINLHKHSKTASSVVMCKNPRKIFSNDHERLSIYVFAKIRHFASAIWSSHFPTRFTRRKTHMNFNEIELERGYSHLIEITFCNQMEVNL